MLARDAALDPDDLERLAVLEAVDHHHVGLVRGDAGQHLGGTVDRVAAHPRPGGVGALAVELCLEHDHALAPASTHASVGSSSTAKSPSSSVGLLLEDPAQAVEPVGDLLALVEGERHVVAGTLRIGVQLLGEAQQDREPALHVGRTEPVQHVAVDARDRVAVGGHGVEVAPEHDPAFTPELRARDHAGADDVDRE